MNLYKRKMVMILKVDNSQVATNLVKMQLMSSILKESLGDSNEFQLVMQSLTNAMEKDGTLGSTASGETTGSADILNSLGISSYESSNGLGSLDSSESSDSLDSLGLNSYRYSSLINSISSSNIGKGNQVIQQAVAKASAKYNVDANFINAVINQESSFNPKARSSAGAMGLMQLMPGTAKSLGVSDPYNIEQNVDGGTKYLKGLLDAFGGQKELALSAYNAGPNMLRTRGVSSVSDIYKLPNETRNYVSSIMKNL